MFYIHPPSLSLDALKAIKQAFAKAKIEVAHIRNESVVRKTMGVDRIQRVHLEFNDAHTMEKASRWLNRWRNRSLIKKHFPSKHKSDYQLVLTSHDENGRPLRIVEVRHVSHPRM